MKTNITILMPLTDYKKKLGRLISNKLGMFFADVEELLQFELNDIQKALDVGGKEYLEREQNKLVKRLASYSNTLITVPFDVFNKEDNKQVLKQHSLIVYFKLTGKNYLKLLKKEKNNEEFLLEQKLFYERDKLMSESSDIVIICENANKNDMIKNFLQKVNEYYG